MVAPRKCNDVLPFAKQSLCGGYEMKLDDHPKLQNSLVWIISAIASVVLALLLTKIIPFMVDKLAAAGWIDEISRTLTDKTAIFVYSLFLSLLVALGMWFHSRLSLAEEVLSIDRVRCLIRWPATTLALI